ncbi:MAG: WD40 repeat domain-containing protein, partial [Gammaproteobacteria bacterium]|nr:WD40 repeat domain-containing protein [Gammaproteobacteria bacterium]
MIQHRAPISGIAAFKDHYVATAGYDNQVILWDSKIYTAIAVGRHDHLANQCEFSPCGHYLVSTSSDYTARLWRVPSMQLVAVLGYHQDDVETAVFHPTQPWIVTASRDKIVRLFDFQGHLIRRFMGHERDVISVAWLGRDALLSCSDDGTVRQWDIHTAKQTAIIDLGGVETDTIVIHPEGTIFAGNDEGNIVVIADNGMVSICAHESGIKKLCYSFSKKVLVSLSYDRNIIVWKVNSKNELSKIRSARLPNCVWARSCAFLGNNKLVLATFGSHYAIYDYKNDRWMADEVKETHGINALLIKDNKTISVGDSGIVYIDGLAHLKLPGLCNFLLAFADTVIAGGQTG